MTDPAMSDNNGRSRDTRALVSWNLAALGAQRVQFRGEAGELAASGVGLAQGGIPLGHGRILLAAQARHQIYSLEDSLFQGAQRIHIVVTQEFHWVTRPVRPWLSRPADGRRFRRRPRSGPGPSG